MKIGILLSGCGVFDGAEIQESVLTMLAIQEQGAEYFCISINRNQHHVIDHVTGKEMPESRNIMVESARIARGAIVDIATVSLSDFDALVIPGGFGSAKNLTSWAFDSSTGTILPEVKNLLVLAIENKKPLAALCVSPVVLALALEGSGVQLNMTIGSDQAPSPYSIVDFNKGLKITGVKTKMKTVAEILVDETYKIVTAPCYMMDATILDIRKNIQQAIRALIQLKNS